MSDKSSYVQSLRLAATRFTQAFEYCELIMRIGQSRDYQTNGDNPITQADIDAEGLEVDVADVQGFGTMIAGLSTLMNDQGRRELLDRLLDVSNRVI